MFACVHVTGYFLVLAFAYSELVNIMIVDHFVSKTCMNKTLMFSYKNVIIS